MNGNRQEGIGRSGLYVDMENFQVEGQSMVQSLIENWPDKVPAVTRLTPNPPIEDVRLAT